jgi:DNA polymerase-1
MILNEGELRSVVDGLLQRPAFVVDVETTSLDTITNEVLWVGLAAEGVCHLVPIGHPVGPLMRPSEVVLRPDYSTSRPYLNNPDKWTKPSMVRVEEPAVFGPAPEQLRPDTAFGILRPLFFSDRVKVGHNLKFDLMSIAKYYGEVPPGPYEDTLIMSHVLDENRRERSLKRLACDHFLGRVVAQKKEAREAYYPELGKAMGKYGIGAFGTDQIARYLAKDVSFTWYLWRNLGNRLAPTLRCVFEQEMLLLGVLMDMELRGIAVDTASLEDLAVYMDEVLHSTAMDAYRIAGRKFPLTNNNIKRDLLFGDPKQGGQGLKPLEKTPTGKPKLDAKTLAHYAEENELARLFLYYNDVFKKKNDFVDKFLDPEYLIEGRIHTSFKQHGTATGRLSSASPNLQQVPARSKEGGEQGLATKIRQVFVASPGHSLVVADYDQVELRCIAALSKDKEMIRLFAEDRNIHSEAAAAVFGIPLDQVSPEMRSLGKTINFGVGYGASARRLAKETGRPLEEAQTFIDRYYQQFSRLQPWKTEVIEEAARNGKRANPLAHPPYVEIPPFGRRRREPALFSDSEFEVGRAQRQLVNAVVQGFASSIMKMAMISLHRTLGERPELGAHLLITVHDEILVEAPEDRVSDVYDIVITEMSNVVWDGRPILGRVPLVASGAIGPNWADAKGK